MPISWLDMKKKQNLKATFHYTIQVADLVYKLAADL